MRRPRPDAAPAADGGADPTRTIAWALAANVVIALAKFAGASVSGSGALLAEGFHSIADCGNEVLLLWGRRAARRPPSPDHPLGHGRAAYFWSFMVAVLLFSAGGIAAIVEGVYRLRHPTPLEAPYVAMAVLAIAACAEGSAQLVALRQIRRLRGERSLWRWLKDTRRSELVVVFAEDAAALTGIAIALCALTASIVTGASLWDGIGSAAIGVLLVVVAGLLGAEIKSLLIGESAGPTVRAALHEFLAAREEVAQVVELISEQHGEWLALGLKLRFREHADVRALLADVEHCEAALRARFPQVRWVFTQPVSGTSPAVPLTANARQKTRGRPTEDGP